MAFNPGLQTGIVQIASVDLTSADILGALATPITIVPAPGAGKMIVLLQTMYHSKPGATPYTGGTLVMEYAGTGQIAENGADGNVWNGAVDQIVGNSGIWIAGGLLVPSASLANKAIVYGISSGGGTAYITGNGTGNITVTYQIFDL